jgi:TAT (twin-arginine translocation) pathway signal sequence
MAELTRRDLFKTGGATAAAIGVTSLPGPVPGLFPGPARAANAGGRWNHEPMLIRQDCTGIAHEISTRQDELKLRRNPHYCDVGDITCRKENSFRINQLELEIGYLNEMQSDCLYLQGHWVFYDGLVPVRNVEVGGNVAVSYDLCGSTESGICVAQWSTTGSGYAVNSSNFRDFYLLTMSLSANKGNGSIVIFAPYFSGGVQVPYVGTLRQKNPDGYLGQNPVRANAGLWRLYKR